MRVAITGTIGSGKSMLCAYIREKGYDVFDCDKENRILLEEGNEGWIRVKEAFPCCFSDGRLDKKLLSQIVFSDEQKRKQLESIMHPLIMEKILERKDDPLICEVPLLFEAGWDSLFDLKVLVAADRDKVIARLLDRGMEYPDVISRLNAQMDVEEKMKRADKIIYNNGSLERLYEAGDQLLEEISS